MISLSNINPQHIQLVYKSKVGDTEHTTHGCSIFPPAGRSLLLGIGYYRGGNTYNASLIKEAIKQEVAIVYLCDKLPTNRVIHENIMYLVTGNLWYTHSLIKDYTSFKGIYYENTRYAIELKDNIKKVAGFTLREVSTNEDLKQLASSSYSPSSTFKKRVVIETLDGLGDILMSLPSAKTLYSKGHEITYVVGGIYKDTFNNLDFVKRVFTNSEGLRTDSFDEYIKISSKLSDYTIPFNQQHRIYATAYFCNLRPSELVVNKPIIQLDKEEKQWARYLLKKYSNTVALCLESHNSKRSYPSSHTQELITLLINQGYCPILLGNKKRYSLPPKSKGLDLQGQTSLRELFSIIEAAQWVITVDSGPLHIAGAFNKKIIALMGPIQAEWRCSTYGNCTPIVSSASCYPCADGTYVPYAKRECKNSNSYCLGTIPPKEIVSRLDPVERIEVLSPSKSILISRSSGFGDVLMTTSVVREIKKQHPEAHISYRTNQPDILKNNKDIDNIIEASLINGAIETLNLNKYDKVIDLNKCVEPVSMMHHPNAITDEDYASIPRIDLFFRRAQMQPLKEPLLYYYVAEAEKEHAQRIWNLNKNIFIPKKPKVVLILGSTSPYRTYPLSSSLHLVDLLSKHANIIILGSANLWTKSQKKTLYTTTYFPLEKSIESKNVRSLVDQTTLREALAIVSECDLIICPDTGFVHASHALNKYCLALFGNINPELRTSYYPKTKCLFKNLECSVCQDRARLRAQTNESRVLCPSREDIKKGYIGATCMRAISPIEVYEEAVSILNMRSSR